MISYNFMNAEFLTLSPTEIAQGLSSNPRLAYKRKILRAKHIPPPQLPIVFHTSSSDGIAQVDPKFCESFDYCLNNKVIPVSYVLITPHVNRVKNHSEVWKPNKNEAFEQTKVYHSYLTIKDGNRQGQIRMGSTMENQKLLAAQNSGFVFKVDIAEMTNGKPKKVLTEYISLAGLPVIDSYQFTSPSPVGPGMGGIETHLPIDIPSPDFAGYHSIREY